jgi:alkaline phosphatase D
VQRRQLFKLLAATSTATGSFSPLWLGAAAGSATRLDSYPFAYGVASGSPDASSVVLWTRLAPSALAADPSQSVPVRWELAHDAQFQRVVQSGTTSATAQLGHSVHVEVQGLQSDRWYHYRFMVGNAVSATGRTRTFPAPGTKVARLRLAYASCQRWEHGYYSAYRHMREEHLDAVMFLGDYIYEYPGAPKAVRMPNMTPSLGFVITLDDYRARYALHKSDPALQAMHAACPWLMSWDDHEVQNDYAGVQGGNGSIADVFSNPADFARRRAAAYQAYYENMPIRASTLMRAMAGLLQHDNAAEMRIYQRVDFGRLASLYLLDTRQYKDPQACTKGGGLGASMVNPASCAAWADPKRTMLGAQQEAWLGAEFAQASTRANTWNVVGQSTLFGQRDNKGGPEQAFFNDGWDGYSAARTRITAALQKNAVRNAVFLGGDVHENWVGHVKADYAPTAAGRASATVGVEFCGTSITSRSGGNKHTAQRLAENPHFVFADAEKKGYGVVEFTPGQLTTTLRVVDDVTRAEAIVETLASFTVQAGRSVVERS